MCGIAPRSLTAKNHTVDIAISAKASVPFKSVVKGRSSGICSVPLCKKTVPPIPGSSPNKLLKSINRKNARKRGRNLRAFFSSPSKDRALQGYYTNYTQIYNEENQDNWSQSNGCLMRCMPLFAFTTEARTEDCKITNPHPVCVEAQRIYFRVIDNILDDRYEPLSLDWSIEPKIRTVIKDVLDNNRNRNVSLQRGWVCHGLYFALMIYHYREEFTTFAAGMKFVIGDNLNSDTDTNGCIAGSVLGCILGYKHLENEPTIKDNLQMIIDCKPNRPNFYHPKHLHHLAIELNKLKN